MTQDDTQPPAHPMDADNQRKRAFDKQFLELREKVRMAQWRLEFGKWLVEHKRVSDDEDAP